MATTHDSDTRRFYDEHHADAVVVLTSSGARPRIIVATEASEKDGDVWLSPEAALQLSRDLARRARAALKGK